MPFNLVRAFELDGRDRVLGPISGAAG